jgi:hypothetical protein
MSAPDTDGSRWAMVLGHPGHELRVLGWLRAQRPCVAVLTDGSGSDGRSRIVPTDEILRHAGCAIAPVYGGCSDRQLYAALLGGDTRLFVDLAGQLAQWLEDSAATRVVSDGVEGYNPTHDLCAALTSRAARLVSRRRGRALQHYTFPLVGPFVAQPLPPGALLFDLDSDQLADKLALSRQYAQLAGGVLAEEVDEMIARLGEAAFAREMLAPADVARDCAEYAASPPYYETYGQRQVEAGRYRDVIRYREHVQPLLRVLENEDE